MRNHQVTIDKLADAVDNDTEGSRTRDAARLLVTAMNDWPTFNQTSLTEFINEFKVDFGDNFDINKLRRQIINDNWKNESKASILEMLKLFPTRSFDDIVDDIIKKYLRK